MRPKVPLPHITHKMQIHGLFIQPWNTHIKVHSANMLAYPLALEEVLISSSGNQKK